MNRFVCFKCVVSFFLVGSYFLFPKYGFTFNGSLLNHFLYPFSHANIWHLLANCLCLFMLRCPLHLFATYVIAVLCSFIPSFSLYDLAIAPSAFHAAIVPSPSHVAAVPCVFPQGIEPIYGFSGILFAMVGISWGKVCRFREMLWKNKWFLIIPAFIPHINFLIHLYCLLFGYLYGSILSRLPRLPHLSHFFRSLKALAARLIPPTSHASGN